MSPYCDWCGRAIYLREDVIWAAVKGVERGYDPVLCDANTDDGLHEPAGEMRDAEWVSASRSAVSENDPSGMQS